MDSLGNVYRRCGNTRDYNPQGVVVPANTVSALRSHINRQAVFIETDSETRTTAVARG